MCAAGCRYCITPYIALTLVEGVSFIPYQNIHILKLLGIHLEEPGSFEMAVLWEMAVGDDFPSPLH